MRTFFQVLLWTSLFSLAYSGLSALGYELYAVFGREVPPISPIVITWISGHRVLATGIAAIVLGFFIWLTLHWFGPQGGMLKR